MEAINIGIPCIITKETNYGEIVEENKIGWMAKLNKESISNKILESYDMRNELEEMCKKAKKYSKNNFNWDFVAKETIDMYFELLKKEE